MKKKYIRPISQAFEFDTESSMLAASPGPDVRVDDSKEVGAEASYSNRGGWNSSLWSEDEK